MVSSNGKNSHGTRRQHGSHPRGFTLIELLVALLLLDVGLLALVGLGATIARAGGGAHAEIVGLSVASARLERLASTPCADGNSGAATIGAAIAERFVESPLPHATRLLVDTVRAATSRGSRVVILRMGARC
jgi:type II secretory pathway pseudopilin PulG